MSKKFVDDTMLNILNRAGNPVASNGGIPMLIQHLQSIHAVAKPAIPNQPPTLGPKRSPRGLTYPGIKPKRSPLRFLK